MGCFSKILRKAGNCLFTPDCLHCLLQLKALAEKFPDAYQKTRLPMPDAQLFPPNGVQLSLTHGDPHLPKSGISNSGVNTVLISKREHGHITNGAARHSTAFDRMATPACESGEQTVFGITASLGTTEGQKQDEGGVMDGSGYEQETVTEWVDQDGVYITLVSLPNGGRDLKRVRFRYVGCVWCRSYGL